MLIYMRRGTSCTGRLARNWLEGLPQVLLVVDWSDLSKDQAWQCLRASVVVQGRSVTLYEQVHPRCKLGNPRVHAKFLDVVASMLPSGCRLPGTVVQGGWCAGVGLRWAGAGARPRAIGGFRALDSRP